MVRDLMLNIAEGDLLTEDKSSATEPVFDVTWGPLFDEDTDEDTLILNVIIPVAYRSLVAYTDGELSVRFKAAYHPDTRCFNLRLAALREDGTYGLYNLTGDEGVEAMAYIHDVPGPTKIPAAQLPCIDTDGDFVACLKQAPEPSEDLLAGKVYIYSGKRTDLAVGFSDNQAAQLLSLCAPGKSYRHPTTGVGITGYLNSVIEQTDFNQVLAQQFDADGRPLRSAAFDSSNCDLDVLFSPERETADTGLADISDLDLEFFGDFSDLILSKPTYIPPHDDGEPEPEYPSDEPEPDIPIVVPTPEVPRYEYVNRGEWAQGERYHYKTQNPLTGRWEISLVYCDGCQWQCVRDATDQRPEYGCADWKVVMGDTAFHIEFAEPQQVFELRDFETTLTVVAYYGWKDITDKLSDTDIRWYRYSENVYGQQRAASDELWNRQRGYSGKRLHLTLEDFDIDSAGMPRKLIFTAVATLPEGFEARAQYIYG